MSDSAQPNNSALLVCRTCGNLQTVPRPWQGHKVRCGQCHSVLIRRGDPTGKRTLAFALTALVLFIPANIYPLIEFTTLGRTFSATIFGGVVKIYEDGMWPLAALVFMTAILIPAVRILGLCYLGWLLHTGKTLKKGGLYRFFSWAGGWSMPDVLMMATLVALTKLSDIVGALPGPGLFALFLFMIVIATAVVNLDRRALWHGKDG